MGNIFSFSICSLAFFPGFVESFPLDKFRITTLYMETKGNHFSGSLIKYM